MLKLEYDKKQIEEVIDKIVKKTMNMDLTWDWPCGVAYYGIGEAYEKTGKKEYLDLLKDRVDELRYGQSMRVRWDTVLSPCTRLQVMRSIMRFL